MTRFRVSKNLSAFVNAVDPFSSIFRDPMKGDNQFFFYDQNVNIALPLEMSASFIIRYQNIITPYRTRFFFVLLNSDHFNHLKRLTGEVLRIKIY